MFVCHSMLHDSLIANWCFFLYASRSCSHTNQDVRGLGSYGFTSGQIPLLILPCVMTSGNITTGLQRVLRLIWYT